jgi:hypothetical protein
MARSSPAGFAFSILFEIAAVVAIVSLLPRVDLRPTASASQSFGPSSDASFNSPVIETPPWADNRRPFDSPRPFTAPPLIEDNLSRPQYVEQRLDRASQQLLNSVGGAVNHAAEEWLRPKPFSENPTSNPPEIAARPIITSQPSRHQPQQQPTNPRDQQPRRWLRY